MQQIREEPTLPRFHKDFIGIGHELQQKRKQRRQVELEERAVANRVLFLEKQQIKAEKNLIKKREKLGHMIKVAERQAQQKDLKQRMLLEREKEVQLAREQNHLRRIMHRQSVERQEVDIYRRNSLDYRSGKQQLKEGEIKKKQEQREGLLSRQERYLTLNVRRDQGRTRIDKFFKKKNFQHTKTYRDRIKKEESRFSHKFDTIHKLSEIEEVLRKRLEQSSQRVSQMDQVLGNFQHSMRERSSSKSRLSLNQTFDQSPKADRNEPTLITSVEGELLGKNDGIEEKVIEGQGSGASEGSRVRRRKRNKHVNRYQEYQQF